MKRLLLIMLPLILLTCGHKRTPPERIPVMRASIQTPAVDEREAELMQILQQVRELRHRAEICEWMAGQRTDTTIISPLTGN